MRLLPRGHVAEESIIALLDGELENGERAGVERHLSECAGCGDLSRRHQEARRALRALLTADAPRAALSEAATTEPSAQYRLKPAAGAAGVGVLAGVAGALMVAGLLARRGSSGARRQHAGELAA